MATPSAPNIYFRPLTLSNSVELYWYPPPNESNITSYIVECSNISFINVLPPNDRKTTIRNLVTGNSYVFTLKATNINGNGNIASFNLIMPGFKPDQPTNLDFTTNISNVSKFSTLNLNFNNPTNTGNSILTYNVATMIPIDVTGNVLQNSQFKKNHSNEGTNNMDPFSYDDFNTNYNYKTYIQSINTVSGSDFKYYDNIINPSLPTNGLKLWLDPYDISTITLSNSKVINWQDKSKNKANASITNTFYPSSISSLQLWLDGNDPIGNSTIPLNGSTISTWVDKSPFKNNAIQYATSGMPAFVSSSFNSKGGINFTGTQMLVLSNAIPQVSTIFVVGRQASTAGNFITGKDSSNTGHSPYYIALRSLDSAFTLVKTDGTTINSTALPTVNNTVYLLTGFNDGTNVTAILNGGTNTVTQSYSGQLRTAIQTYLGTNWYDGSFYYPGCEFNEIIIYNTAISQSEREKVEGYLAWKWGLQSNLPSNHPWKNTNPSDGVYNESIGPTFDSSNALINFNGNQYLNLPANTLPSANSSYSIFTYVSTSNIAKSGQWFLYSGTPTSNLSLGGFIDSNIINHSWFSNNQTGNSNISTNISYLIELTYDAGIRRTYLNGNLIAQSTATNKNSTSANNLIGTNSTFDGNLHGSIGDIIIYNRLLNTNERASVNNYLERKKYNLALNNIGNVVTWLDASDPNQLYDANNEIKVSYNNKVYNWNDRSYANNNASQSNVSVLPIRRPYIQNNLDVLEFDKSFLTIPSSYYPLDAFMVLKLNYNITSNGIIGVSPNSNNYSSLSLTGNKWSIDATSNSVISSNTESSANFLLMEWSIGNNNNFIKRYGSNIANSSIGTWSLPSNANIIIGNSNGFNFNNSFKGYIGEIILFNKQLGDDYRLPIEGYLAWKWGLQSFLDSNHPYKNSAPYLFPRYISANQDILSFNSSIFSLFAPDDITGLQTWFDANDQNTIFADTNATTLATTGNVIARWNDKSGNGNYLYQNTSGSRPLNQTFNSKRGVYFTSGKQLLSINNNTTIGNNPRTIFVIIYAPSDSSRITIGTGNHAGNTPPSAFGFDLLNSGNLLYYPYVWSSPDNIKNVTIKNLSLIQIDYGNGVISGKHNFDYQQTSTTTLNTTATPWYFGYRPDGQNSIDSYVCEFIQYNRLLSVQEIQQIEGYLAWKWGINSDLPSNHPYYSNPPYSNISYQFNPSNITTQQLWLDASDPYGNKTKPLNTVALTSWKDKSNANNIITAGGTTPNYVNNNVEFNGNGYYTTSFSASLPNETTFVVFNVNNITGFQQFLGSPTGGRQFFFGTSPNGSLYVKKTAINDLIRPPSLTITAQTNTLLTYQNNNSNVTLIVNASSNISAASTSFDANKTSIIGAYEMGGGGYNDFLNGKIREIIGYSSALSLENIQKIEGYLAWKWNLVSNLPSNHPYKNYIPSNINSVVFKVSQLFGYPGFNITIDGFNLSGPVLFNGISASIVSNNGTSMVVTIPSNSSTGPLLVNGVSIGTFRVLTNNNFTPDQIQTIQAWFDGSDPNGTGIAPINGTVINTWVDKSLKRRNALGVSPATFVTDSPGYLNFNGTSNYYTYDGTFISNKYFTIFIVERLQGPGQTVTTNLLGGSSQEYSQNLLIRYAGNTSGMNVDYFMNSIGGTVQNSITTYSSAASQPTRLWTFSQQINNRQTFINGNIYQSDTNNVLVWGNLGAAIGRDPINNIRFYPGHIKEIIFYTDTMTKYNQQKVEGYLAWKWGLQSNLPSNHFFKNASPSVNTTFSPALYSPWSWFDSSDTSSISLSGSNVTSIQNKGSNGVSITPQTIGQVTYNSSYTMNGKNLITVNSNTSLQLLNTNYTWNGSCIMVVVKYIQSSTGNKNSWYLYGGQFVPQVGLSNGYIEWGINAIGYPARAVSNNISANENVLLCLNVGGTSNTHNALGINGTNFTLTENNTTNGNNTTNWSVCLCIGGDWTAGPAVGIAEHIIFNRGLNTTERQEMEGYLAWKWGLQSNLPSNHPYKNSAP